MKIHRENEESDIKALQRLFFDAYDSSDFMAADSKTLSENQLVSLLNKKTNILLTYSEDNKLLGYVLGVYRDAPEFAHRLKIQAISVIPEFRGRGIGRKLMEKLLAFGKESGFDLVYLEVASDNSNACKLYESFGMKETGNLPDGFRKNGKSCNIKTYAYNNT